MSVQRTIANLSVILGVVLPSCAGQSPGSADGGGVADAADVTPPSDVIAMQDVSRADPMPTSQDANTGGHADSTRGQRPYRRDSSKP